MGAGRWGWRLACVGFLGLALLVVGVSWRRAGSVDPVSASMALVSLAVSMYAARQGWLAQRQAELDTTGGAARLADAVRALEDEQREQVLTTAGTVIDVGFTLVSPAGGRETSVAAGGLEWLVKRYRELSPRRLVITGPPGSGKTVMAVELIRGLLATRGADDPVPVRLSVASWNPDTPLRDFIAAHLTATFQLRLATARALVGAGRVLPVLDGLDEMDQDPAPGYASRAGRALRAVNQEPGPVVLTCRTGQYEALDANDLHMHRAIRVELAPVGSDQAWEFIQALIDRQDPPRWRPVLDALTRPGHPLAVALSTPWRLTMAVVSYQQRHPTGDYVRDPGELATQNDPEQVHQHLLELYLPAAIAASPHPDRYPAAKTRHWLGELAAYLNHNTDRPPAAGRQLSSTDLVLHELWPLAGVKVRIVNILLNVIVALPLLVLIHIQVPNGFGSGQFSVPTLVGLSGIWLLAVFWERPWPGPRRIDLTRLTRRTGLRFLAGAPAIGIVVGLSVRPAFGLALGLVVGLGVGFAGMFTFGLRGAITEDVPGHADPRYPLRADILSWLTFGLVSGLAVGLAGWLVIGLVAGLKVGLKVALTLGFVIGFAVGLKDGLAFGLTFGLTGSAVLRYVAFLSCVRGRLPWRLGAFLHWCQRAGLTRTAGIAYQFRHRELQDHLADHPTTRA